MSGSLLPGSSETSARRATLVQRPRPRAPKGAELVRFRLPDCPGSLAAIAGHLAAYEVDVLRLEVLGCQGGYAIDDLLLSGPGLDSALSDLPAPVSVLARRPGIDLRDPALAMASACASVTAAGDGKEAHRSLVRAALELVFAEAGLLCLRQDDGSLRIAASTEPDVPLLVDGNAASLLSSALYSGECLTADGRIPWAPPGYRDNLPSGAVAAIPGGSPASLVLVLLRDDPAPFVAAELDRLAALVGVAVGTLQLHEGRRAWQPSAGFAL